MFADSSGLVELYADEAHAALVRSHTPYVVSAVARVEVPAAFWCKHRTGELSAEDSALLAADFAADWHEAGGPFVPVALHARVLHRAATLVASHGLRADGGVQLACASAAREADPQIDSFLCLDAELSAAAAREDFQLLP